MIVIQGLHASYAQLGADSPLEGSVQDTRAATPKLGPWQGRGRIGQRDPRLCGRALARAWRWRFSWNVLQGGSGSGEEG